MRTLYIECNMGAAGDMLMAALYELIEDKAGFLAEMNGLGLGGVRVSAEASVKCGITGTHMAVTVGGAEEDEDLHEHKHEHTHEHEHEHTHEHEHKHEHTHEHEHEHGHEHEHDYEHEHDHGHSHSHTHEHSGLHHITHTIEHLDIPASVKRHAARVFGILAEAEAAVHDRPLTEVHFHEVGTADAVADIVGVCLLMHRLKVGRVFCSPINVGGGFVKCAHGVLPVPAPATARILLGLPTYGGEVRSELCTPTGAALLRHFAGEFGGMPVMRVSAVGYGMGRKDFPAANCVRAFLGEAGSGAGDTVAELACNLDDMDAEAVAFAAAVLLEAGALDVYTSPIVMKKGRAAVMLTCLCEAGRAEGFAALMLKHTTTFGVRKAVRERYVLDRREERADTGFGAVRVKYGEGYGVRKYKVEYEDLAAIAKANDMPIDEIRRGVYAQLEGRE